mgnify:CR=1 FL=1
MSESVIFGLDGVLANNKHRLHHIEKDPPDWRAFYGQDAVEEDGGFSPMIQLCQQLSESNTIIILTERPIAVSEVTRRWLKWHGLSREVVFTRQDRSYDLVADYKIEEMKRIKREGWKPWLVIDCDPEVVRKARSAAGAQGLLV